ncbi:MAG: DUF2332 domain-containing protein [Acidimicrobiia bacterium]
MDTIHSFRLQAAACGKMGSDLYRRLLRAAADDLAGNGELTPVVGTWDGDPVTDAVPLRLLGGVHRLVLRGEAPGLAFHYPTVGGRPSWPGCTAEFFGTVRAHPVAIETALSRPPQTNEIGRAAPLIGGLIEVTTMLGAPIRLLEIGASAGLNLLLDHYRFELGDGLVFGPPSSPVVVTSHWSGRIPALNRPIDIVSRRGCDLTPLDVRHHDDVERLLCYVWADQLDRFDRLRRAIELARSAPTTVDAAPAAGWLLQQLARSYPGAVTVVMQSCVTQYLSAEERHQVLAVMRAAGTRATREAPVAWLRMEPAHRNFELTLSVWPQDLHLTLADVEAHGRWVAWHEITDHG